MARSTKSVAVKTTGTSLATIDQELSNEAANLKNQLGQSSSNKISVDPKGEFILPDGANLGSEIQVVVVDFVTKHSFYSSPYTPQSITPPDCYAIGKDIGTLAPEADSPSVQHGDCATCPLNAFGSAANKKAKACKNERLLVVLFVDPEAPDAHNAPDAPLYALSVSPSNLTSFDGAAKLVMRQLNGPPVKAIFTVTAENVGTYAKVTFRDPVPNPDYAAHYARRAECQDMLFRKPDFAAAAARQPARRAAATPARRGAAGGRR